MGICENCGNEYAKTFKVTMPNGGEHVFDCLECAVQVLAPECYHCDTKILGHGLEANGNYFCCAHCARAEGRTNLVDNMSRIWSFL
jgi:hypothetical protein